MPEKLVVLPGRRFGRLRVVREGTGQPMKNKTYRRRTFICRCDCGSPDKEILLWLLTTGGTKSCGCLRREMASVKVKARKPEHKSPGGRIAALEAQNRKLTAELGAMRAELDMARARYR